jgi:transposase InsO family protein
MKQGFEGIAFKDICQLFGKSRQAWYDMEQRHTNNRLQQELILQWIMEIRATLPRTGGVKLYEMLKDRFQDHNIKMGRDGLFELLRTHGLLIYPQKKYVRTTQSWHHYRKWPNLLHNCSISRPDHVWVSDITFLRTENGFIYLSVITDAFSRKIVGYHLSQHLKASGCIAALHKAISHRQYPLEELIHHSDRGIQYCCDEYVQLLQAHQIRISMTQSGSPYDNAIAERVNGILKQEFALDKVFKSYSYAVEPVAKAIHIYNHIRPHFSCNLQTPAQKHYLGP